jgi:hypothetical protein
VSIRPHIDHEPTESNSRVHARLSHPFRNGLEADIVQAKEFAVALRVKPDVSALAWGLRNYSLLASTMHTLILYRVQCCKLIPILSRRNYLNSELRCVGAQVVQDSNSENGKGERHQTESWGIDRHHYHVLGLWTEANNRHHSHPRRGSALDRK